MTHLVKTHIKGLDEALGGGFPRPGIVLVVGHPGTGKTILSIQYLAGRALRYGERGLYILTSQPLKTLNLELSGLNIGFNDAVSKGLLDILEFLPVIESTTAKTLIDEIISRIEQGRYVNIVVDSVTALVSLFSPREVRTLLSYILKCIVAHDMTCILIGELPLIGKAYLPAIEEFIADMLIKVEFVETANKLMIRLIPIKSRGSLITRKYYEATITKDGFELVGEITLHTPKPK